MKLKYPNYTLLLTTITAVSAEPTEMFVELEPMVIIGNPVEGFETESASFLAGPRDIISRDELEYEHPDDTLELFSKVPGVNIARYNQGIINTDVGIRGFGTDGTTPHAKLLIDGIPSNIHNGYNELDQMFPLAIGAIDVFKGTSDLRYGLYNVAGSYNVYSRTDIVNEVQTTVDSFGSYEFQGYSGTEIGKLTQSYFLGYRDAKGYRDHTDLQKYTISGLWSYGFSDVTSLSFSARTSSYEGDSPGYLDRATAASDPTSSGSFASLDSGEKEVNQFSLSLDTELLDGDMQVSLKSYYNDIYRQRYVRFTEGSRLEDRSEDQGIAGFIATVNWDLTDVFSVQAGLDFQHQDVEDQRFRALMNGTSLDQIDFSIVRRDQEYTLENFGGYIGVEHQTTDKFRWNAGLRFDTLDGDFTDNTTSVTSDAHDFDVILQPKLNLIYDINDAVSLFANYGRTFQAPLGSNLYETGSDTFDVNINDGGEIGVVYYFENQSNIRLSLWNQVAENEFQEDQINFSGYREVGEVDRRGLELAFNYKASEVMTIWGNYGYTMSEIKEDSDVFPGAKGNEVRGTPNYTYSLGTSYKISDAFTGRLTLDGQGDYYVNENNSGGKFGDYNILSAGLDYVFKYGLISLQVNNLTDEAYEYVYDFSSDATTTIHSPGDGINASLSYKFTF